VTAVVQAPEFASTGGSTAAPGNVSYRLDRAQRAARLAGTWLDCGCADGGYSAGLRARGVRRVVGIDPDLGTLRVARHTLAHVDRVAIGCAHAEILPFGDAVFDGVLLNEVLEHVSDETSTLRELHRVLRPGGALLLMSPNRWFPFEGHGMVVAGHEVLVPIPGLPWLPAALGRPLLRARNYWPGELRRQVEAAGFVVRVQSTVFPVFEQYPVLPAGVARWYRRAVPWLERLPGLRKFGVSSFIVAAKPGVLA
jgi:SAM-dependent methyltransferase